MKLIAALVLFMAVACHAAPPPPIIRNPLTTNAIGAGTASQVLQWGTPPTWAPPGASQSNVFGNALEGGVLKHYAGVQAVLTLNTNTKRFGINFTNTASSIEMRGFRGDDGDTAAPSAGTTGRIRAIAGFGGNATNTTSGTGGQGGQITLTSGSGGSATAARTNAIGANGGAFSIGAGDGGADGGTATNAAVGGVGGIVSIVSGAGGAPSSAATNTVGGTGGDVALTAGVGGTPSAGLIRQGGTGGDVDFTAGASGTALNTNAPMGGVMDFSGGEGGGATNGTAGKGGYVALHGGRGGFGTLPGNGGDVRLDGGLAQGGTNGDVLIGSVVPGKVGINTAIPTNEFQVKGHATIETNLHVNGQIIAGTVKYTVVTPDITVSNLVVSGSTNTIECVGLTNVVVTNLVEEATGTKSESVVLIRNTLGVSVPIVWPAFGPQHGYYFHTNGINDVLSATVAPPGTNTALSFVFVGTNIYPAVNYYHHP